MKAIASLVEQFTQEEISKIEKTMKNMGFQYMLTAIPENNCLAFISSI